MKTTRQPLVVAEPAPQPVVLVRKTTTARQPVGVEMKTTSTYAVGNPAQEAVYTEMAEVVRKGREAGERVLKELSPVPPSGWTTDDGKVLPIPGGLEVKLCELREDIRVLILEASTTLRDKLDEILLTKEKSEEEALLVSEEDIDTFLDSVEEATDMAHEAVEAELNELRTAVTAKMNDAFKRLL